MKNIPPPSYSEVMVDTVVVTVPEHEAPQQQLEMMDMALPLQSSMIPPPSYSEIMVDTSTVPEPPAGLYYVEFGPEPLQLTCWSCHSLVKLSLLFIKHYNMLNIILETIYWNLIFRL